MVPMGAKKKVLEARSDLIPRLVSPAVIRKSRYHLPFWTLQTKLISPRPPVTSVTRLCGFPQNLRILNVPCGIFFVKLFLVNPQNLRILKALCGFLTFSCGF